jgi:hypothetical protein
MISDRIRSRECDHKLFERTHSQMTTPFGTHANEED